MIWHLSKGLKELGSEAHRYQGEVCSKQREWPVKSP